MSLRTPRTPRTLVLASRSPRRARLLTDAGYVFVQAPSSALEPPLPPASQRADPERVALDLAGFKARNTLENNKLSQFIDPVVLAADTLVVGADGSLLGQPIDVHHAQRMLHGLIGATHRVVTAVVLADPANDRWQELVDWATVTIGSVEPAVLQGYLTMGQWRGKAGGYNLAELEGKWPISVTSGGGSVPGGGRTTVIGLPMDKLVPVLRDWGITTNHDGDQ